MNIQIANVVSAVVHVDNSSDEARKYDIFADIALRGTQIEAVNGGQVRGEGQTPIQTEQGEIITQTSIPTILATFNYAQGLTLNFNPTVDVEEQVPIIKAINDFIASVSNPNLYEALHN